MASPDIKLLFGVNIDSSVAQIKRDLENIFKQVNSSPVKLKVQLDTSKLKGDIEQKTKALEEGTREYARALKTVEDRLTSLSTKNISFFKKFGSDSEDLNKMQANTENLMTSYEGLKLDVESGTVTQDAYRDSLAQLDLQMSKTVGQMKVYEAEQKNIVASTSQLATTTATMSFGQQFMSAAKQQVAGFSNSLIGRFSGIYGAMTLLRGSKEFINTSIELESQLADLQIVSRATGTEFERYGNTVMDTAQKISTSVGDLVSATTTFARLGYSLEESGTLAEFTGMLERVGDIDTETAEKAITSILKAFPEDADVDNIERVMDKLVKVGNNFPISVEQIALGMGNASSALSAAGNNFEQSVALLTAANTTVQDALKSSTGLRTIAARLRNTKVDIDEEDAITASKYEEMVKALTDYNVKLTDAKNEYRSTYDIMKDLAAVWDDINSLDQAALATNIAGVRQQNVFFSLIEQFKEAENAMDSMENSVGELSTAYAIYEETTRAHLTTLSAAWTKFAHDTVNSDTLKFFIDLGTAVVNAADTLSRLNILLPTIIASVAAIKTMKIASSTSTLAKNIANTISVTQNSVAVNLAYKQSVELMTEAERRLVVAKIQAKFAGQENAKQLVQEALAAYGFAAAETTAEVATNGLSASLKAMPLSNPVGWIAAAVALTFSLGSAFVSLSGDVETAERTLKRISDTISDTAKEAKNITEGFADTKQQADELIPRYVELAQKTGLTVNEQEELVNIQNKLVEVLPELDGGLDTQGNHILRLKDNTNDLTAALYGYLDAARAVANANVAEKYESAKASIQEYYDTLNAKRQEYSSIQWQLDYGQYESGSNYSEDYINSLKSKLAGVNDEIDILEENGKRLLEQTIPILSAMMQTTPEFLKATSAVKDIASNLYSNINFGDAIDETSAQAAIDRMNEMVNSVLTLPKATQDAVEQFSDFRKEFLSGEVVVGDYISSIESLERVLVGAGLTGQTVVAIMKSLGKDTVYSNIDFLQKNLKGDAEAIENFVNTLTSGDIDIAYNIVAENGSMTIDELEADIKRVKDIGDSFVDSTDLSKMFENIGTVTKNIDKITDAMKTLKNGTALTKSEMMKLAEQFPNLLKQSNLFTDGSIKGQKKMLQSIIDSCDAEYDAVVDTKIKELEATLDAIEEQKKIEKEKVEVLLQLSAMKNAGMSEQDANYVRAVARLNALQSQNYIEMVNGNIRVNEEYYKQLLNSDARYAEAKRKLEYYESMMIGLQRAGMSSSDEYKKYERWANELRESLLTGSLDAKILLQESQKRIDALNAAEEEIQNTINNLKNLKDLPLTSIYTSSSSSGSSGSSSSGKSAFELEYDRRKHLVSLEKQSVGDFLKWLNDAYKEAYKNGQITLEEYRKYELEVFNGEKDLVKNAKSALDALISYRTKMLKEARTKEKDDLKERLNALKEFYDKQKQMLKKQRDEEKYLDEQAEKRSNVTRLREQLAQLAGDPSSVASKLRVELQKQLSEAEKDLSDFERDKAVDVMTDKLDEMYEAQKNEIESQVKAVEEVINDPTTLYNEALAEIRDNTAALQKELQAYNTSINGAADTTVTDLFNALKIAVKGYQAYYGKNYNGIGYASGTSYATSGIHRIDEAGSETIFQSASGGRYRLFTGGDKVLNASDSDFLYKFATSRGMTGLANGVRAGIVAGTQNITMGNIIINGNASEKTVSEIRRAQRDGLKDLLTQLGKLNK